MAEPQDAVLPILKNIQERIGAFEKRTDASLADLKEHLLDQGEKIGAMQGLMTYHLGMTTEQRHQLTAIQKEVKELRRVSALDNAES